MLLVGLASVAVGQFGFPAAPLTPPELATPYIGDLPPPGGDSAPLPPGGDSAPLPPPDGDSAPLPPPDGDSAPLPPPDSGSAPLPPPPGVPAPTEGLPAPTVTTETAAAGIPKRTRLNFQYPGAASMSVEYRGLGPTGSRTLQIGESNTCTKIDGSDCIGETLRKIQATLNDPCAAGSPLKSLCDKVAALESAQDECATNNGGCGSATSYTCGNNVGAAATCAARQVDINDCASSNGGCDSNAACSNTAGLVTCTCNSGYTGNGFDCTAATPVCTEPNIQDKETWCATNSGTGWCEMFVESVSHHETCNKYCGDIGLVCLDAWGDDNGCGGGHNGHIGCGGSHDGSICRCGPPI